LAGLRASGFVGRRLGRLAHPLIETLGIMRSQESVERFAGWETEQSAQLALGQMTEFVFF